MCYLLARGTIEPHDVENEKSAHRSSEGYERVCGVCSWTGLTLRQENNTLLRRTPGLSVLHT
jgi:hypothetical protein